MAAITLTVDREMIDVVEGLLIKLKASELADLRRARTQLSVYGDRRASMEGDPVAIEARMEVLSDLLRQIREQR